MNDRPLPPGWHLRSRSGRGPRPDPRVAAARQAKADRDRAAADADAARARWQAERAAQIAAGTLGRCPACLEWAPVADGILLRHTDGTQDSMYCGAGEGEPPLPADWTPPRPPRWPPFGKETE
jgi:hypothetical protein